MTRVAHEAAQQAIQPAVQATALQASRQNFLWAAQQLGADGAALVDPAIGKIATILKAPKNDRFITPSIQLAAAKDVLDRNGYKPPPGNRASR